MDKIHIINNINVLEHSVTILNSRKIEDLIKEIKNAKLSVPLAIHIESKSTTQLILKVKEDKQLYGKIFTIVPWNSEKKFEYIVSVNKFTTKGDDVTKYLKENKIESIMEPIFVEDIFTGTFKLYTSKKLDEKLRKFTKGNIIYYINIKQQLKIIEKVGKNKEINNEVVKVEKKVENVIILEEKVVEPPITKSKVVIKDEDSDSDEDLKLSILDSEDEKHLTVNKEKRNKEKFDKLPTVTVHPSGTLILGRDEKSSPPSKKVREIIEDLPKNAAQIKPVHFNKSIGLCVTISGNTYGTVSTFVDAIFRVNQIKKYIKEQVIIKAISTKKSNKVTKLIVVTDSEDLAYGLSELKIHLSHVGVNFAAEFSPHFDAMSYVVEKGTFFKLTT